MKLKLVEDRDNLYWKIIKPPGWFERLYSIVRSTILAILYFALGFITSQIIGG